MKGRYHLWEIHPPAAPSIEFQYWRALPWVSRKFGCPDCRKACRSKEGLRIHLRKNHPRWQPFFDALDAMRRPAKLEAPEIRAKKSAAARAAWARPGVRQMHLVSILAGKARPEVKAKYEAGVNRQREGWLAASRCLRCRNPTPRSKIGAENPRGRICLTCWDEMSDIEAVRFGSQFIAPAEKKGAGP